MPKRLHLHNRNPAFNHLINNIPIYMKEQLSLRELEAQVEVLEHLVRLSRANQSTVVTLTRINAEIESKNIEIESRKNINSRFQR
jgi:hypothetical protein